MGARYKMVWQGDTFRPAGRFWEQICGKHFVPGKSYFLTEFFERSDKSHRDYFGCINEAFKNLPENLAFEFPTPEHLRHRALIACGYYTERQFACASKAEAHRLLKFMQHRDIGDDDRAAFAAYSIHANIVIERTALSQKYRAMGRATFQKSKEDVLAYLADLIGIEVDTLRANAEAAA